MAKCSNVGQIGILDSASKRFGAGPPAVALGLEGEDVGEEASPVRTRWVGFAGEHAIVQQAREVLPRHAKDLSRLVRWE